MILTIGHSLRAIKYKRYSANTGFVCLEDLVRREPPSPYLCSMRKLISIVLFGCICLYVNGQDFNTLSFGTDETFDFATWNIEWFPKDNNTAEYVGEILTAYDLDLIAFQEIDDTTLFRSVIEELGGYEVMFESGYYGGLALAWKTEVVNVSAYYEIYTTLPFWNAFPRSPQVIEFSAFGEEYVLVNNHFKCCGDGQLDAGDSSDEEARRLEASELLKTYADQTWYNRAVIITGDLNDLINDPPAHNVLQSFIDDPNYAFADAFIAEDPQALWSYPSWPSHLDHILVNAPLLPLLDAPSTVIETLAPDAAFSSWWTFDNNVTDHRPVAMRFLPGQLSVPQPTASTLKAWPNPATEQLVVDLPANASYLIISDMTGRELQRHPLQQQSQLTLTVADLQSGVYFLRVKTRDANMLTHTDAFTALRFVKR